MNSAYPAQSTKTDPSPLGEFHLQEEQGSTRRSFLRGVAVTAAAGTAVAGLTGSANVAHARGNDQLQVAVNFVDIRRHERAHVAALVAALGANARPKPTFQHLAQRSFAAFATTSQALENTGVGAYLGAAPAIFNPAYLAAAGSIALIEARHAGWLNDFNRTRLTVNALGVEQNFETPFTYQQVTMLAGPFIASLNGGPPLMYDPNPADRSPANDIAILNFALALEYLEHEFYDINVRRFFPGL